MKKQASRMQDQIALRFIEESNRIEGIHRSVTLPELEEFHRFMALDDVTMADLEKFVSIYQPDAKLRTRPGMNVRVGNHIAPLGGANIGHALERILKDKDIKGTYGAHVAYELLHPFTDGNGRSGRMLWLWMMREAPLGFLHTFYYQALSNARQ